MDETQNAQDIKLTWYEKKQGLSLHTKTKKVRGKLERKERRARSGQTSDRQFVPATPVRTNKKKPGRPPAPYVTATGLDSLFKAASLPADIKPLIADLAAVLDGIYHLNSKQRALLPQHIRALSHKLTDEREDRRLGYMNETTALSAYAHYYLWWNLIRLTRLFANMPDSFFSLDEEDVCLDIGSGPLTVPIARFLARPELRMKRLCWYCMDISAQSLLYGENIFLALAARLKCEPWKIIRVKGEFGTPLREKADFVSCANMFNELAQDADMPPDYLAKKYSEVLLSYTERGKEGTRVLVVEPGVPSCARFISLLRDALIRRGFMPASPCPHAESCPMDGKRDGKWCNYAFSTEDAPRELMELSESAGLVKDRAVLSFIAAVRTDADESEGGSQALSFRIASDPIRLPHDRTGYYACSRMGLLLVVTKSELHSGDCLRVTLRHEPERTDWKSGALIVNLD